MEGADTSYSWFPRSYHYIMIRMMTDVEQDQILEQFIALAKTDKSLQDEIKSALNQDQVIAIAAERGFQIDPMAILRKWSKHTDFSKPTWMGWFTEWT